jgi:hypothetical protein
VPESVRAIAWKAQIRLCHRYRQMMAKGKLKQVVVTAIARELAGFVWAISRVTWDSPDKTPVTTAASEKICPVGSTGPIPVPRRQPRKGTPRRAGATMNYLDKPVTQRRPKGV